MSNRIVALALAVLVAVALPAPAGAQDLARDHVDHLGQGQEADAAATIAAGTATDAVDADDDDDQVVDMDTVVVSGAQPGPGLWKASKGDHVLYILGTQSPLPRDMQWQAREVREVLAQAGAVLSPPYVSISADVGFFRGLALAPSALKAMKNPGKETLDEVLPADTYARWSVLKQRYLGRDRGVEKKRPLIAVYELYREALKRNGLREGGIVGPVIAQALKERGMKATPTSIKLTIDDPREAIADFRKEEFKPQDLQCFADTLDVVEHGLPQAAARANAWAVGDLAALRAMPQGRSQLEACLSAWTETETARKRGLADLEARILDTWLAAVDKAVAEHPVSFASLSIGELLGADGYLSELARRGYTIQAPDELEETDDIAEPLPPQGPGKD